MKQFFDKHMAKFTEKEALSYIHDKIEEAKYCMLNGESDSEYLPKLEEAHEMLADYISRKTSPETSLSSPVKGRSNPTGWYYPSYPYGKKAPYFK